VPNVLRKTFLKHFLHFTQLHETALKTLMFQKHFQNIYFLENTNNLIYAHAFRNILLTILVIILIPILIKYFH